MTDYPTPADMERRFDEINALPPETETPQEAAQRMEAEAMDDGTAVSLSDFQQELEGYSGRLVLRLPRSLHRRLKEAAAVEGVSLNQYLLYKLSR